MFTRDAPATIQASGMGPFVINYLDPKDDPRGKWRRVRRYWRTPYGNAAVACKGEGGRTIGTDVKPKSAPSRSLQDYKSCDFRIGLVE